MIYKAIRSILQSDSDFATAIGTDDDSTVKVYSIFPTAKVEPPFCTVTIEDQAGNYTKDGSDVDAARVSIRIHDYSLDDMDTKVGYVRTALLAYEDGGTADSVTLASVEFESFRDGYIPRQGDIEVLLYRELFYEIWVE